MRVFWGLEPMHGLQGSLYEESLDNSMTFIDLRD